MIIIYESFDKLEASKKLSIINAGFLVFGANGYRKASIDQIIQEADISKGSLFYYFGSKKNFFLYLYEYAASQLAQAVDYPDKDGIAEYSKCTDFFERLDMVKQIKLRHYMNYPHMYSYIEKAAFETDPEVKEEIARINQRFTKLRAIDFMQNLDIARFKEGIDPSMVLQLVTWCSEGCANTFLRREKLKPIAQQRPIDFNEVMSMYDSYMELLRNSFYKAEFLSNTHSKANDK